MCKGSGKTLQWVAVCFTKELESLGLLQGSVASASRAPLSWSCDDTDSHVHICPQVISLCKGRAVESISQFFEAGHRFQIVTITPSPKICKQKVTGEMLKD